MGLIAALALLASPQARGAVTRLPEGLVQSVRRIEWTPARLDRLIAELPKVETHLHLDGALSPRTIKALAVAQKHEPLASKSLKEIAAVAVVSKPKDSLGEVLQAFRTVYPLLQTPEALETVAYEVVKAARKQNIRHLEARFAPALQATETFSQEQALQAVLRGLARGEKEFGVRSGVIVCLIRGIPGVDRAKNERMTELAIAYRGRGVVGLDLAGNETAQPLSDFRDLYERAKAAGLRTTAHAGEVPGSRDVETALELGVDRLGHATLLSENPALLEEVRRRGVPIEVNLTSNVRTSAVGSVEAHPARQWYEAGIPVTFSTDDPGVFGIDLNGEYRLLPRLSFSPEDIVAVAYQGIDALFLPEADKQALRERFAADVGASLARLGRSRRR
jgi:adenosine deaminase